MLSKIALTLILGGIAICGAIAVFDLHLPSAELFFLAGVGMILVGVILKVLFGKMPSVNDNPAGSSLHGGGSN